MTAKWTKDEKDFAAWVTSLGCYLTQYIGLGFAEAKFHHVGGRGRENYNYLGAPLSDKYHANYSVDGWHGQRKAWRLSGRDDMDALAWVIKNLWEENKKLREANQLVRNLRG